jgi:hypothetical protein
MIEYFKGGSMKLKSASIIMFGLITLLAVQGAALAQVDDQEQRKLAQTGLKFLGLSTYPRAAAMGDAVTSLEWGAAAMFFNPSGMARVDGVANVSLGYIDWIADIQYNFAAIAFRPARGRYGVFGLNLLAVDYGDMQRTIRADTDEGFVDLGEFKPTAMAVGLGYANAITERFAVGGNVKFVSQNLGTATLAIDGGERTEREYAIDVVAFDFGVLYHVGLRSLNFAMSVRNFSQEIKYEQEGFQLPLTFRIGLSMNVFDLFEREYVDHRMLVSLDAERPRDYYEQVKLGLEYEFLNSIALRAGYVYPSDEQGISLGIGLQQTYSGYHLGLDYAYTDFGVFSTVHRFSLQFSFK